MERKTEISVIVPVYQVEAYLPRCIESILRQSFIAFDLILVDDGSLDRGGEICDKYASLDKRIVVIHQKNMGLSEARNSGIDWALIHSESKWITFIDSDDWVHEDYLKILHETARVNNVGLSICNCIKTKEFTLRKQDIPLLPDVQKENIKLFDPEDFWCFRQYGGAWAKLYRKTDFNKIRYPKGLLFEDAFVTYRLIFAQSRIAYIDVPLYYYFIREGSILQSAWNVGKLQQLRGYEQQMSFFKSNGFVRAYNITVLNYLLAIRNHIECICEDKVKYYRYYFLLMIRYKYYLFENRKILPIGKYTHLYRFGFPGITRIYKVLVHLKERWF